MDMILLWLANSEVISIANYFFAGFLGSLAARMKIEGESEKIILKRLIFNTFSDGIMGGFAGMFMTRFFDDKMFVYSIAGIAGAMGFRNTLRFLNQHLVKVAKDIVQSQEKEK